MRFGSYCSCQKRYKFLLLKDVLTFSQLDSDNQQLIKEDASKFRRVSVGVQYVNLQFSLIKLITLKKNGTKLLMKPSKLFHKGKLENKFR